MTIVIALWNAEKAEEPLGPWGNNTQSNGRHIKFFYLKSALGTELQHHRVK